MNSKGASRKNSSRQIRKLGTARNKASTSSRNGFLVKTLEILHVILFFTALFITIALVGYVKNELWVGQTGNDAAGIIATLTFGSYGAFAVPIILFLLLARWWSRKRFHSWRLMLASLLIGFFTGYGIAYVRLVKGLTLETWHSGLAAYNVVTFVHSRLHPLGTALLSIAVIVSVAVVMINLSPLKILSAVFYTFPVGLVRIVKTISIAIVSFFRRIRLPKRKTRKRTGYEDAEPTSEMVEPQSYLPEMSEQVLKPTVGKTPGRRESPAASVVESSQSFGYLHSFKPVGNRQLPPIDLLHEPPEDRPQVNPYELEENSKRLEEKLKNLGISAQVVRTVPGPVITRYDLEPAAEVKIARIASLSDDIAMALRARGVRILAPIPGEAMVGVEIPNKHPGTVYIREVVGSKPFSNLSSPLTIALGKDASGNIFCTDLARMPHLLIAGATGSGKSVCVNILITSLLFRSDPRDVRLVLIDPKKLELSLYARLVDHHLVSPPNLGEDVITTPENSLKTLQSVHIEMERRYSILADAGVRGLEEYNRWIDTTKPSDPDEDTRERLPYLVVVIDELADLMIVLRKEFEDLVARLAQMARAVGIHLVVATQRPSVDVVTGLIKANFPARIAFQVASGHDSRTIIGCVGAESLLGKGDMLFQGPGARHLVRLHGALITTEEVEDVVEFVRAQPPCESKFTLPDTESVQLEFGDDTSVSGNRTDKDELFDQAAKIVVHTEQGSISILQRRLRVGYARAARLIDQLEKAGIVGPFENSKARRVLATLDDLRERFGIE